jgi:hypothetical protein
LAGGDANDAFGQLVDGVLARRWCSCSPAKLLADAGRACAEYQDKTLRELPCKRVQLDEIWSFVYAKQDNVRTAKSAPRDAGDAWTWTAICADTKLLISTLVGRRDT